MNIAHWITNFGAVLSNKIDLPSDILFSKLSFDEATNWILRVEDIEDYYNYFPIYVSIPGHQIRVYYININIDSENYHKISTLIVDASFNNYQLDLNYIDWKDFKVKNDILYQKIIS